MLEVNLSNEEKVRIVCKPTTLSGQPAQIDGALQAECLDPSLGSVLPGDSSTEVQLVPNDGVIGDVSFRVFADADLTPDQPDGSGKQLIEDVVVCHVSNPRAQNLGLVANSPEPK